MNLKALREQREIFARASPGGGQNALVLGWLLDPEPITEEWLREVWGFTDLHGMPGVLDSPSRDATYFCFPPIMLRAGGRDWRPDDGLNRGRFFALMFGLGHLPVGWTDG